VLAELNFELWIGDAAEIQTKRVRKAKTDPEDARLLLRLLFLRVSSGNAHSGPQPRSPRPRAHVGIAHYR